MDTRTQKAFDFASDLVKQFLILGIAIITLTATFSQKITDGCAFWPKFFLIVAWILYFGSIFAGLFTLAKMATQLIPEYKVKEPSVYGGMISKFALTQIILFITGLIFTIAFAISML